MERGIEKNILNAHFIWIHVLILIINGTLTRNWFFYPPPFMICRFISCVSVYLSVQFNLLPIEEVKSMRPSHLVIFGLAGKKGKRKKKENKNKSLAHSCSGKPWEVLREKNSGGENLHPDRGWGGCSRPLQGKIHFITLIIIIWPNGLLA